MASLIVKITGDASGFKSVTDGVGRGLDSISTRAEKVSGALGSLGNSLSIGLTLPAVAAGAAAVRAAADFEKLNKGLASIMGSTQAGAAEFRKLQDAAKLPGLGLEQAVAGSIRLQVLGNSADKSRKIMAELGNAIALVGGGKDDFAEVTRQLGQMLSVGKVTKENLDTITERIPQISKIMIDTFGPQSVGDPAKYFEKAGISSRQFVDIIIGKLSEGARAGDTFANKMGNLEESVKIAAASVGEKLIPTIEKLIPKMESLALGVTGAVAGFLKLPNEVQNTAIALGAVAIAAGPAIKAIQGVTTAITTMQTVTGIASAGLAGLFGAVVIAGIVQTMSAIDKLNERYRDLAKARSLYESGKADPSSGMTQSGEGLGKFKIDLKAVSDELNLFGLRHDEAKPKVAALGHEIAKTAAHSERAAKHHIATSVATLDMAIAHKEASNRMEAYNKALDRAADIGIKYNAVTYEQIKLNIQAADAAFRYFRVLDQAPDLGGITAGIKVPVFNQPKFGNKPFEGGAPNVGDGGMMTREQAEAIKGRYKEVGKAGQTATRQVSLVMNDLARGITDVIFKGGKLGDMLQSVASQAAQSITRLLIEGALSRLASKLFDIGGLMGKVFGGATSVGGSVFSAAASGGAGAAGSVGSAASAAGGIASAGITGIVGAVASIGTLVSGIVGNFQNAKLEGTMNQVERNTAAGSIHLMNTLNKANEYWPYMKNCWESLIRMEQRGMGLTGGGGVQVNMAGAYLLTDSALDDFIEKIALRLKTQGI